MWISYKEQPVQLRHSRVEMSNQVKILRQSTLTLEKRYLELLSHYIVCKCNTSGSGMEPTAYMDVKMCRLETHEGTVEGNAVHIIVLSNQTAYENIYFYSPSICRKWVQALMRYCVGGQIHTVYPQWNISAKSGIEEGAYGFISLVPDPDCPDKKVVIKTYASDALAKKLRPNSTKNDPGSMTRDEVRAMRRLNHPGIVALKGVYEEPEMKILVTDYLEGGNLYEYLKKKDQVLNWKEALVLTKEILDALVHMEQQKVVHRDIKQGNIMIKYADGSKNIALIDFGFAICLKDYPPYTTNPLPDPFGTIGYFAPEVMDQHRMFDCRVDVYSTGLVLFGMLVGESAISTAGGFKDTLDRNTKGMVNWHLLESADRPQDIPADVLDLLRQMLQTRKKERPFASQLMTHKAFNLLKIPGQVPHPKRTNNYKSISALEEDHRFFITKANVEEVSQLGRSSYRDEGD